MRSPHLKLAKSLRRPLLRHMLLSICIGTPCSVMLTDIAAHAEEGATQKPVSKSEQSGQPAFALPTFPSSNTGTPVTEIAAKLPGQLALLPTPPSTNSGLVAVKSESTPAAKSSKDSVSIKFGAANKLPAVATPTAIVAHPGVTPNINMAPIPTASQTTSFRLSDKVDASTTKQAPPATLHVPSAVSHSGAPVNGTGSATTLKLSDKLQSSMAKVATPTPEAKEVAAPAAQAMTPLTVSKEGVAPTAADKLTTQPPAVIFRPNATLISIPQATPSITPAAETTAQLVTSSPTLPTHTHVAKPSTKPAAEPKKSVAAKSSEMKSVASTVSPLPPTAMLASPINLVTEVKPPQSTKMDDTENTKSTNLVYKTDGGVPAVISDAVAFSPSNLAPKEYSTPANRTIQVGTASLTTMKVGDENVVRCEVDDNTVCRAIVTADGEVALLPGRVGVTRATLWLKQPNGKSKVETADIHVGEIALEVDSFAVAIEKLNQNLQRLYPSTNLRAVVGDRCIEIRGEAEAEQQAREVLQLVRKLCLVPVKDKVTVR